MSLFRSFLQRVGCCAALLFLCGAAHAGTPAVALYYGHQIPLLEWRAFDIVVVEPDHAAEQVRAQMPDTQLYAYVSVAEVLPSRGYYQDILPAWKLARNEDWQSDVVDQSAPGWPEFFASRVVGPLWERGYRGFFLDTLDSYRLAKNFDEKAQQQGLVRVVELLHQRFPGIQLILNRGFDILPQVRDKVQMVAAESLYRRWNARGQRYEEVPEQDRQWLAAQLRTVQQRDGLPVLVIDYAPPHDRELTRQTAEKIRQDGFIPWVSDAQLSSIGIGSVEAVPRRVMVLYNGQESPALNYSNPHRYLQMPLNHMGYVTDYVDVRQALPEQVWGDRYAGVVTWLSGYAAADRHRPLSRWLQTRVKEGMPVAVVGAWGIPLDPALARTLGLAQGLAAPRLPLRQETAHPNMGLETAPPLPSLREELAALMPAMSKQSELLVDVRDQQGRTFAGGAYTPWGGFVLDPYVLYEVPGTEDARWIVDPFAFLQRSLRLPPIPVPDTTTENGRRLLLVHVDGDGYNALAEFAGSPPAAQVLLREVFEKYRIPQTMSIVEAEVAPHGLSPELSPRLEDIARQTFRLPHIEIGSHTFSHPFLWDTSVRHGLFKDNAEAALSLNVPGYTMDLTREIVGSSEYINQRLAPPGKKVQILQWSGDTAPNAEALAITARAGLLNINGGDTYISRANPSLTAIGALGIRKQGHLQVYAPITNENIYTHLWTGPYYGFERAIETFQMTDAPRRIKPVGIYYHTYSASKRASLHALHKVYGWALAQPLHPVHASQFARKVQDFYDFAIARGPSGWRLRGNGELRTVRLPPALGTADVAASTAVAGWRPGVEGTYVHLTGTAALLQTGATPAAPHGPRLYDSNARLAAWRPPSGDAPLLFSLQGHVPLEFSLANARTCRVQANQRLLAPVRTPAQTASDIQQFKLTDASAHIQVDCPAR